MGRAWVWRGGRGWRGAGRGDGCPPPSANMEHGVGVRASERAWVLWLAGVGGLKRAWEICLQWAWVLVVEVGVGSFKRACVA